ncbi:MAG: YkgJ family cysteine cluster protein [Bryobacterales bacterium]|nr:YkgJ family cysteine cluster protein [Bryobacteraceae bacterium]MDW8130028.1 YkgJ family cysteine cluster protein [Bryobacterales bacterium]
MPEEAGQRRIEARFRLRVGNRTLEASVNLPAGPVTVEELLPVLYAFADAYLSAVLAQAEELGCKVSCAPGCGACCAQLVPVSEAEARRLARLIEQMPAMRRAEVLERFRRLRLKLEAAGLWERLRDTDALRNPDERRQVGREYFALREPCPFLEDQSCSIYPNRPMRCREYFVTSPPAHCADPQPETVRTVPLPVKLSEILFCFDDGRGNRGTRWMALSHILEWAAGPRQSEPAALPAVEMFRNFLNQVAAPK